MGAPGGPSGDPFWPKNAFVWIPKNVKKKAQNQAPERRGRRQRDYTSGDQRIAPFPGKACQNTREKRKSGETAKTRAGGKGDFLRGKGSRVALTP